LNTTPPYNSEVFEYRTYVYAWDDLTGQATDAIFTSAILTTPAVTGVHKVTVDTDGVLVGSGNAYVLFLSTIGLNGAGSSVLLMTEFPGNYNGGRLVYRWDDQDASGWTTTEWSQIADMDLAFEATFSADAAVVPEPITLILLGSGLAGVGALRRRRRLDLLEEA
jgi:hypothetical protein